MMMRLDPRQASRSRQLARWRENWAALHSPDARPAATPDDVVDGVTDLSISLAGETMSVAHTVVVAAIALGAGLLGKVAWRWWRRGTTQPTRAMGEPRDRNRRGRT